MSNWKLTDAQRQALDAGFAAQFGGTPTHYFSAPGRAEIGGNHTDHQCGRAIAAAVNLDTKAAVRCNGTDYIRILSQGYPLCQLSVKELAPVKQERNTTIALIRGVVASFVREGCRVQGFDAYCQSTVLPGSGLSSSAAFEVLMGTILNHLFFDCKASKLDLARIGQYAENVYFGKLCGMLDQIASAVGNLVSIDFRDRQQPVITPIAFDFSTCGHALCIIDTRGSHADLNDEYSTIPMEMLKISSFFGKEHLAEVDIAAFYASIPVLREKCGDRAVLRAMHIFGENQRVPKQVAALEQGDFEEFLSHVRDSGRSSWMYLQNVIPTGRVDHQEVAISLALCEHLLAGRGAFRIHGGGFAGTVEAFVPFDLLEHFRSGIDAALGEGACYVLSIRPEGSVEHFV